MSRQPRHWRSRVGMALILCGAVLLVLTALGRWTGLGRYADFSPRSWERFDPAMAARTPSLDALFREAQSRAPRPFRELPPEEKMRVLHDTVADRFTNGDRAKYSPLSNWFLWALGAVDPLRRDIQAPDVLLRNGHSALCGDVSYVLIRLAEKAGIPARHVHLEGHILMEAWYAEGWRAYDPDLEVVVQDGSGAVYSVERLIQEPSLLREAYSHRGDPAYTDVVVALFTSVEDNRYISYPRRGGVGVKGQRPGRIEQAGRYAAIVLPVGIILAGGLLARTARRGGRSGER